MTRTCAPGRWPCHAQSAFRRFSAGPALPRGRLSLRSSENSFPPGTAGRALRPGKPGGAGLLRGPRPAPPRAPRACCWQDAYTQLPSGLPGSPAHTPGGAGPPPNHSAEAQCGSCLSHTCSLLPSVPPTPFRNREEGWGAEQAPGRPVRSERSKGRAAAHTGAQRGKPLVRIC